MRISRLQRRIGAITLPVMVLALASCGGSSGSQAAPIVANTGTTVAPGVTLSVQDREQKLLDFAACMRKNGVAMDDPTFDATGNMAGGIFGTNSAINTRSDGFKAAMKACGSLVQGIGLGGGTAGNGDQHGDFDPAAMQAAFNDFTSCLRTNGLTNVKDITFGRPDGDKGGRGGHDGNKAGGNTGGSGGGVFGSGNGATTGSMPPGDFNGPPPGGSLPTDNGHGPGGAGFDPTQHVLDDLGLNASDPAVKKATDACKAILTKAFAQPPTSVAP